MPSRWCDETVSHRERDRTLVMVRMRDRAVRAASNRAGSLCTLLLFLALMPIIRVDGGEWGDADDPLRLQARSLIASVRSFLGGSSGPEVLNQLRDFLLADASDLAEAGVGGVGSGFAVLSLGLKRGGWRRHLAGEEGAVLVLTDVVSTIGEPAPAAAAARCLAMLAAASSKAREEASVAGTIKALVKMITTQSAAEHVEWSSAQAAAAEAIWSLVFASKSNHAEALRRGAVPAILQLAKTTENEWTRMWCMASLHNLAEDYCESSDGTCPWVQVSYEARGVKPDRRGHSDHNARVTVDSSAVRLKMNSLGLIPFAVSLASMGPTTTCPDSLPRGEHEWTMSDTSLVAWAGAAVLKSLAFSHVLHSEIVKAGAIPILSTLRKSSCALEADAAENAMKRLIAVTSTRNLITQWEKSEL